MYEFSLASLMWGLAITAIGAAMVYFHKPLADWFGGGLGAYNKHKLYGLAVSIFGVLILFNIPQFLLSLILSVFFAR